MAAFNNLPLEDGRRAFLKWIEIARPHGSVNNQVTVVFDGNPDFWGAAPSGEIKVIFSDGGSADDKIKSMVEEAQDRRNYVVVTDDKDIFIYARSSGAKVMKVKAFTQKTKNVTNAKTESEKYISLSGQQKITQELEKIWLKKKP